MDFITNVFGYGLGFAFILGMVYPFWSDWMESKNWLLKISGYLYVLAFFAVALFGLADCAGLISHEKH